MRISTLWKTLAVALCANAFCLTATAQTCAEPPSGLVAWFPGDGNGLDLQGGDSASILGPAGAVTVVAGKVAQALQFNGGGYLQVIDQPALDPTAAVTLEAWINPSVADGAYGMVAFKGNTGSAGGQPYSMFFNANPGARTVDFRVGNDSTFDALGGVTQLPLNTYTHVAATYDGTTMRIYINGVLDASKTTTIGPLANSSLPLLIGHGHRGILDELGIYNRALAQSELQAIVAAGSAGKCKPPTPTPTPASACVQAPANLTAWFPGDGNAVDLQGGDSGTNAAGVVTFAAGHVGQAFQFDGQSEVAVVDQAAHDATNALTLDAWINPVSANGGSFVFRGNRGGNPQPYSLFLNGNRTITFRVGNNSTFDAMASFSSVPLNTYSHIAATYDGTRMRIYINGVLDAVKTTTIGTLGNNGDLPLYIGTFGFQGAVDELEIFNRVLSLEEIQLIVGAGRFGKCKNATTPPPPQTACIQPPSEMTAWYAGDGTAEDIQGGNDGTIVGSGVTYAAGKVAEAFQFNGNGEVQVPDASAQDATNALTLDAWINPTSPANTGSIVFKGNRGGHPQPYSLFINGDRTLQFRVGNAVTFDSMQSFNAIPLSDYTHVAATYDGVRMRIYLNGVLDSVKTTGIGTLADSDQPLFIGTFGYQGAIDELEIFNRVLTLEEIQLLVAAGSFGKCKCPEITLDPATLPGAIVGTAYQATITPSAGQAPFTFTVKTGTLPPGLQLNQMTGEISGTPTTTAGSPFQFTVAVVDANDCDGERDYEIAVSCPSIALNPASLPNGTVGSSYNQTVTASGGTAPYTFAASAGALPPGLTLNTSTGQISGSPTAAGGPFKFTIRATDANGCTGARAYSISTNCVAITLSPSSLANGLVGAPYNQTITASGTPGPFTFAVTSGGLPAGLSLNASTGQISGTPTAAGSSNFTITATDETRGCSGNRSYLIAINALPPPCEPAGALDPTFDGDGFVATTFADDKGDFYSGVVGTVLQSDGKIIAAGTALVYDEIRSRFAVARYQEDGSLDPTWGNEGRVLTSFRSQGQGYNYSVATATVAQTDGKILVAGYTLVAGDNVGGDTPSLAPVVASIARYNPDGSLDPTFDGDGLATPAAFVQPRAMALQADGKIVLAGWGGGATFSLMRLNPDGSLDDSFGTDGQSHISLGPNTGAEAYAIAVQPDGKLVVGGRVIGPNSSNSRFALVRCDSAGALDPSFGQGGVATVDFGPNDNNTSESIRGIVIQPGGKIVSAGGAYVENTGRFALTRHNADGTVDNTFGTDGKVTTDFGQAASALAVVVQPDNKIVATGTVEIGSATTRYHANGALDSSFGTNGRLIIDNGALYSASALLLQSDGKIVAGGTTANARTQNFALARFDGSGCPSTNGKIAFVHNGADGPVLATINRDGSGQTTLPHDPGAQDSQPSFSRDGTRIVVARFVIGTNDVDIFAMNADGSNQVRLTDNGDSEDPSLSGAGTKIAFTRAGNIWVMDADGSNQLQLTTGFAQGLMPSFSIDGTKIAFSRGGNLWVMNSDGSQQTQLTNLGAGDQEPSFSPDGTKIVFSRSAGFFDTDIYVINVDGTNLLQLTGAYSQFNGTPSFSPDGTQVLFTGAWAGGGVTLHVMNADGSDPAVIPTSAAQANIYPSWGGTAATTLPLSLTTAVSRKMHGALGPFDIPLPLTGAPGVECRSTGGNHTIVLTFSNDVVNGTATIASGAGSIAGSPAFAANTLTVNLTGVADVQQLTLTLSGVTDEFGQVLPTTNVPMKMLSGDTNGNSSVNATDVGQTKAQSGNVTTAANFRSDVNANGSINASDVGLVKSRSGTSLP